MTPTVITSRRCAKCPVVDFPKMRQSQRVVFSLALCVSFDKISIFRYNIPKQVFDTNTIGKVCTMQKKFLSVLLAAGLVLSLAACENTGRIDEPNIQTDAPASTSDVVSSSSDSGGGSSSGSYSSSKSSSGGSSDSDPDDYSFEDYLKDNDPDSYEFYQDLEEGWDSGDWDSENGFAGSSDSDFEDYLYENDKDSYDDYQSLEDGWSSGTWDPENGFFQ